MELARSEDFVARLRAVEQLRNCRDRDALEMLRKLACDESEWVRGPAIAALGRLRDRGSTELLLAALQNDEGQWLHGQWVWIGWVDSLEPIWWTAADALKRVTGRIPRVDGSDLSERRTKLVDRWTSELARSAG